MIVLVSVNVRPAEPICEYRILVFALWDYRTSRVLFVVRSVTRVDTLTTRTSVEVREIPKRRYTNRCGFQPSSFATSTRCRRRLCVCVFRCSGEHDLVKMKVDCSVSLTDLLVLNFRVDCALAAPTLRLDERIDLVVDVEVPAMKNRMRFVFQNQFR